MPKRGIRKLYATYRRIRKAGSAVRKVIGHRDGFVKAGTAIAGLFVKR
ncbi:MAG: hypothetical protein IJJ38_08110 [Lachnospiraceae bacterium]|nr:hypothetical protein [Lachnospiraceae bacterium]